jgi:hypothetical protein
MLMAILYSLVTGLWFSPGTLVSSTYKTDLHDINEILLKVSLSTINNIYCTLTANLFIFRQSVFNKLHTLTFSF